MTKATGGVIVQGTCLLLLLLGPGACDRGGAGKAPPKETAPSAATTPTPTPTPAMTPPPNPSDIPAPPDVAAPPADAEKTATGLASKVLNAGTGKDTPAADDKVKVHYTGWTTRRQDVRQLGGARRARRASR